MRVTALAISSVIAAVGVAVAVAGDGGWGLPDGPLGGSVYALAVDPQDPDNLYAVAGAGRVFRSGDAGESWTPAGAGLPRFVARIAIDAVEPAIVYAATGKGLYKSVDRGERWTKVTDTFRDVLVADPVTSGTLYTDGPLGVHKSSDAGASWTALAGGPRDVSAVAVDANSPGTLYAGTRDGAIFKTDDGGRSWRAAARLRAGDEAADAVHAIQVDPRRREIVYATTDEGVFKSTNGGSRWQRILRHEAVVVIDPQVPLTVYAAIKNCDFESRGPCLWKSTDGGRNWRGLTGLWIDDVGAVAIDPRTPSTLYIGLGESGVYKSVDAGHRWRPVNTNLVATSVWALSVHPKAATTVYAGLLRGGLWKSTDGGVTWSSLTKPRVLHDPDVLAINPGRPTSVYAGTWDGLFKSGDGGRHWRRLRPGPIIVRAFAFDPRKPATVYAADGGLLKSVDAGKNWRRLRPPIGVDCIAVDPKSPSTIYVGGGNVAPGLARSRDGGRTWQLLTRRRPRPAVVVLAIDPSNPAIVYAGDKAGRVLKTTDDGRTWHPGDDLGSRINALAIDPRMPSTIYAGNAEGVFRSTDAGASWRPFDEIGVSVRQLVMASDGRVLYAGTDGAGVFDYRFAS
jgi:photosystem II stability/assembly factor-like uncharacterized protein